MKDFDPVNAFKLRDVLPVFVKQVFNVWFELTFQGGSDVRCEHRNYVSIENIQN